MRELLKRFFFRLIQNSFFWKILQPVAELGSFLARNKEKLESEKNKHSDIDPMVVLNHTTEILNGPFKGMKYPKLDAVGSALYPKLLGSYESEIQSQLEELIKNDYSEIIDVGCAEGYYAVGMALRCKSSKIFAYDTNQKARQLCQEMAQLNGVADRVDIRSKLSAEKLEDFNFSGKGLIICDCEGYEKFLFNEANIGNLKNCDLIIETHDFIDIEISTYLKKLLAGSHDIISIFSSDDIQKALLSTYPEIDQLNLNGKRKVLGEGRPSIMEWMICLPKK
jgi:hypothetical protein